MYDIPEGAGVSRGLKPSLASVWCSPSWSSELPARLNDAFRGSLPADGAALLFAADASRLSLHAVCASPGLPVRIEDSQEMLGEGPALVAFRSRRPVLVHQLGSPDERWQALSGEVSTDRESAMYAFPLEVGTVRVGVLDLYRVRSRIPTANDIAAAVAASAIVAGGLLDAIESGTAVDDLGPWSDPRGRFMAMRRATTAISAQLGVGTEEASLRLRAHAFRTGCSLSVAVADAASGRLRLDR